MSEQDQTQTDAKPVVQPTNSEKTDNASGSPDKDLNAGEKLFSQAELDAIVKDRLKRAEDKAAADSKKAADKAAADAMAEQGKFKELSETQAKQILDLTTERDAVTAERDTFKETAGKYEKALNRLLETYKAGIPEHVKPLLDRLDPVDQLDWISANQESLKGNAQGQIGVPRTPPADGRGLSAAQKEAVQVQTNRFYRERS
jgi:hypothetical protein